MDIKDKRFNLLKKIYHKYIANNGRYTIRECCKMMVEQELSVETIIQLGVMFGMTIEDCVDEVEKRFYKEFYNKWRR